MTVVDGIERLNKLYQYHDSPSADGRIKRGHNHVQVDERKTKERRKNDVEKDVEKDVENGVD